MYIELNALSALRRIGAASISIIGMHLVVFFLAFHLALPYQMVATMKRLGYNENNT